MLRLLGEGGFSYVYLVQDTSTSELFALKKIRCPFGEESVSQALKEVEAYTLFSPNPVSKEDSRACGYEAYRRCTEHNTFRRLQCTRRLGVENLRHW
jgi:serine/threonine protein kinase